MQYPCIEATLDITLGRTTVRLWVNQHALPKHLDALRLELGATIAVVNGFIRAEPFDTLVPKLAALPDVNAVQVLQHVEFQEPSYKVGCVVYTVPFEDVHG